jgi:hypothetical protein
MKPDKRCIELCVRKGSKYGLWVGHQVYELEPQRKAAAFAAQNVEVKGVMNNHTIHITSIKPTTQKAFPWTSPMARNTDPN